MTPEMPVTADMAYEDDDAATMEDEALMHALQPDVTLQTFSPSSDNTGEDHG